VIFFFSKPARCGHTQSALGTYLYRAHKTPHTVLLCARISREKCQMSRTESRMFSINYFRKKIKTRRNAYTEKTRLKHICAVTRGSSESAPSAPPHGTRRTSRSHGSTEVGARSLQGHLRSPAASVELDGVHPGVCVATVVSRRSRLGARAGTHLPV